MYSPTKAYINTDSLYAKNILHVNFSNTEYIVCLLILF
jgi:hypothetical protein